jgi:hypothetical protein
MSDCAEAALAALDRALEDRPERVYDDLADAVRCIVRLRGELITERRNGELGGHLERCSAILSLVVGAEYPLAGIRRDRIRQAREELALIAREGA